ncbi:MAG: copper chaperone PCu(A)C [Gammaproteobacteria bacterium]|nr:copper chaperone PCu(A)C [Gammaproteobacteria bacterium]
MRHFIAILLFCPMLSWAGNSLRVTDAWLRALPPGQPNSAAYMVLNNAGEQALTIVAVSSQLAQRVEIHESRQQDGMWRMQAQASLSLAAGQTTVLAPGGRHLMLFGLKRSPREGEQVQFELTLQGGEQVLVTAQVRGFATGGEHDHPHTINLQDSGSDL